MKTQLGSTVYCLPYTQFKDGASDLNQNDISQIKLPRVQKANNESKISLHPWTSMLMIRITMDYDSQSMTKTIEIHSWLPV